jgi:hypothetical protein
VLPYLRTGGSFAQEYKPLMTGPHHG